MPKAMKGKRTMKKQKKKHFGKLYIILLCLVVLVASIYIRSTRSEYTTAGTGKGTANVALWNVKFAGGDQVYADTFSIAFTPEDNPDVIPGKIAPGMSADGTGYIKLTGTETSVYFTIEIGDLDTALSGAGLTEDQISALDFTVSAITASNVNNSVSIGPNGDGTYSGTVPLPNGEPMGDDDTITFVVTITWNDDGNSGVSDTLIGTTISQISLPVTVTVMQQYVDTSNNTLMAGANDTNVFGYTSLQRSQIAKINFAATNIIPAGNTALGDVGLVKDGTIMAWYTTDTTNPALYDLTIGSSGGVKANANSAALFANYTNLTDINFTNFDTSNVTTMQSMFYGASSLTSLDVSSFDTSNVINMQSIFYGTSGLTSLDVSNFNTANVTNMQSMFNGASSLTSLDVSSFDTSNVRTMNQMFRGTTKLESLDLSNFNTSNVEDISLMFYIASSLTSLDVSSFNTSNVTTMSNMFYGDSSLTTLDVRNFNTSNVTTMQSMFQGVSGLASLDLSSFDTANVTTMIKMFYETSSLNSLDFRNAVFTNVSTSTDMFTGTNSTITVYLKNASAQSWIQSAPGFPTATGNAIIP